MTWSSREGACRCGRDRRWSMASPAFARVFASESRASCFKSAHCVQFSSSFKITVQATPQNNNFKKRAYSYRVSSVPPVYPDCTQIVHETSFATHDEMSLCFSISESWICFLVLSKRKSPQDKNDSSQSWMPYSLKNKQPRSLGFLIELSIDIDKIDSSSGLNCILERFGFEILTSKSLSRSAFPRKISLATSATRLIFLGDK